MPKISGVELIQLINSKGSAKPPVLLTASIVDQIVEEEAERAGAIGIIPKPYTIEMLGSKIKECA